MIHLVARIIATLACAGAGISMFVHIAIQIQPGDLNLIMLVFPLWAVCLLFFFLAIGAEVVRTKQPLLVIWPSFFIRLVPVKASILLAALGLYIIGRVGLVIGSVSGYIDILPQSFDPYAMGAALMAILYLTTGLYFHHAFSKWILSQHDKNMNVKDTSTD